MRSITWLVGSVAFGLLAAIGCQPGTRDSHEESAILEARTLSEAEARSRLGVERIVRLETTPESSLGAVSSVKVSPLDGSIYVLDSDSTRKLYRFGSDGSYLSSLSPPSLYSPSTAPQPWDFEVLRDGNVVFALDRHLVLVGPDGSQRGIVEANSGPVRLVQYAEGVCSADTANEDAGLMVSCYDSALRRLRQFHSLDARVSSYLFASLYPLAATADRVYVADYYDPTITIYDAVNGNRVQRLMVAHDDVAFDSSWPKTKLTETDRKAIRDNVNRFQSIFVTPEVLVAWKAHRVAGRPRLLLIDVQNGTSDEVVVPRLLWDQAGETPAVDTLVGAYRGGVVGLLEDETEFQAFASYWQTSLPPRVGPASIENPALAFIRVAPSN